MTLAAAIKAGAVCMQLLSPDVLFCTVEKRVMICEASGCVSPDILSRDWRKHPNHRDEFLDRLYGRLE